MNLRSFEYQTILNSKKKLQLDYYLLIDMITIGSSIMMGLLFITSYSSNKRANIFLGLSLWSLSLEVIFSIIFEPENTLTIPFQSTLFTLPLLVFYIQHTINHHFIKWHLLLLLPGVIENIFPLNQIDHPEIQFTEYGFNLGVLIYSLSLINKHSIQVTQFYSETENKTLRWLKIIVFIHIGFHALWIIEDLFIFSFSFDNEYFAKASSILTLFNVYWIGHHGFNQATSFQDTRETIAQEHTSETNSLKITITEQDFDPQESQVTFNKMTQTIQELKLYQQPKLNLNTLSHSLKMNNREVSKLINLHSGTNFHQYINQFRITDFKKQLHSFDSNKFSILGMAKEAGFQSKSTFYSTFKNIEGMTPKQYELSIKESE